MNIIGEVMMWGLDRVYLEDEEAIYNAYLEEAGIGKQVTIGANVFMDDYEVFVQKSGETTSKYFNGFQEAFQYCKAEFPDANWEAWD